MSDAQPKFRTPSCSWRSKCSARAAVLRGAGLVHEQITAGVDEESIVAPGRWRAQRCARQVDLLAEIAALRVSVQHSGVVLGADQMLDPRWHRARQAGG